MSWGMTGSMAGSRNSGLRESTQYSSVRMDSVTSASFPLSAATSGAISRPSTDKISDSLRHVRTSVCRAATCDEENCLSLMD